jgi:gluconate 2-dehydrogenase gamma chain
MTNDREQLEYLTAAEAAVLEAFLETLIPSGADGLGAREARVSRFIDRALAGALSDAAAFYRDGLQATDAYARRTCSAGLADLDEGGRTAVLTALESGAADGFGGGSSGFFQGLRDLALQGMFGDPRHGGNADHVGWRLIGYSGVRMEVSAEEQAIGPIERL